MKVLLLAREMGVLRMGTVALDGTEIRANASRHSALSHEHAGKVEVADLPAKAEAADQTDVPDGMSIREEPARREDRLEKRGAARAKIEARARHPRVQMAVLDPKQSIRRRSILNGTEWSGVGEPARQPANTFVRRSPREWVHVRA